MIFLIHRLATAWKKQPPEVYGLLKSSGALENYILKHFEVLHTLGERYLVEDIASYLKIRGVQYLDYKYLVNDILDNQKAIRGKCNG